MSPGTGSSNNSVSLDVHLAQLPSSPDPSLRNNTAGRNRPFKCDPRSNELVAQPNELVAQPNKLIAQPRWWRSITGQPHESPQLTTEQSAELQQPAHRCTGRCARRRPNPPGCSDGGRCCTRCFPPCMGGLVAPSVVQHLSVVAPVLHRSPPLHRTTTLRRASLNPLHSSPTLQRQTRPQHSTAAMRPQRSNLRIALTLRMPRNHRTEPE
jgi:hypothetical protein